MGVYLVTMIEKERYRKKKGNHFYDQKKIEKNYSI